MEGGEEQLWEDGQHAGSGQGCFWPLSACRLTGVRLPSFIVFLSLCVCLAGRGLSRDDSVLRWKLDFTKADDKPWSHYHPRAPTPLTHTTTTMPPRRPRVGVYNTPSIRNGGFGALQVEAINNKPLSIARRHLAASQLRMRAIEPEELSSGEWVRFLVMDEEERERWITRFEVRRRRNSDESTSSAEAERESGVGAGNEKEVEARQEAENAAREERRAAAGEASGASAAPTGTTPTISMWARAFDDEGPRPRHQQQRPRHARIAAGDGPVDAPPTYESAVRSTTPPLSVAPPPAYEPRSDDEEGGPTSRPSSPPMSPRRIRWVM